MYVYIFTNRITHLKISNIPQTICTFDFNRDYTSYRVHKFYLESKCDVTIKFLSECKRSN